MKNIFKSAGIATLLTGLVVLVGAIALAKPAFADAPVANDGVVAETTPTTTFPAFENVFKNATPAPTPGAAVLFGMGGLLVFTTQKKFARA